MSKVKISWKAYPMDKVGVKSPRQGVVEVNYQTLNQLHEQVMKEVRHLHPELSATPILVVKFRKGAA